MKWRNLLTACTAISIFGFAQGITYPLLSLLLESQGVSSAMMGINAAMMPIGILLFSPMIPVLSRRFGSPKLAVAAATVAALLLLTYKLFNSLEAWFIIRLIQGMSVAVLFVLSEAWILQYAGNTHRGKVVALYGAVLAASFASGPALIGLTGIDGWLPFIVGSAAILLSIIPLIMIQEEAPILEEETTASGILSFALKAPVLLSAVLVFAIFDASTLSFLPIYGLRIGLDIQTAALALTALIIGDVLLQFPIGWMADTWPRRKVLAGLALSTICFAVILHLVSHSSWFWPVLLALGASGYGIYTVTMAELGDRFSGSDVGARCPARLSIGRLGDEFVRPNGATIIDYGFLCTASGLHINTTHEDTFAPLTAKTDYIHKNKQRSADQLIFTMDENSYHSIGY